MTDADNLKEELKKSGFMDKSDFSSMLEATKDLTMQTVIDHENCGNEGCNICGMKSTIDGSGYERGVKSGIQFGQKYPEVKVIYD